MGQMRGVYAKTIQKTDPKWVGLNASINYLKEHLKIGAPIYMKTGRSGSFGCSEFQSARTYIVMNKYPHFVECGIPLDNGKMVRECFLYQDIIEQHHLQLSICSFAPYVSQI